MASHYIVESKTVAAFGRSIFVTSPTLGIMASGHKPEGNRRWNIITPAGELFLDETGTELWTESDVITHLKSLILQTLRDEVQVCEME